jgi:hypothetical protein
MPAAPMGPPDAGSVWSLWTGAYAHHAAFRTARSALAALLAQRGVRRLWMPAYACDAIAQAAAGVEALWYGVGADLRIAPGALSGLRPGDAVLAIDYFGRSPDPAFRRMVESRRDVLWIEDRAQALAPDAPAFGDVLLYSPRKLLGVGDGGVLVGGEPLPRPDGEADDGDRLWAPEDARARDPDGRDPGAWFPLFRAREAAFKIDRAPIGARSRAALEAARAAPLIARRRANYARLLERLADFALWPGVAPSFAPLAFPVAVEDRDAVAGRMGERGVFCARHWAELPSPKGTPAWDIAARILSIPCDHRYGDADMDRAARALKAVARPRG